MGRSSCCNKQYNAEAGFSEIDKETISPFCKKGRTWSSLKSPLQPTTTTTIKNDGDDDDNNNNNK